MFVYEIYLINKHKPIANSDDKAYDDLSFEIETNLNWINWIDTKKEKLIEKWRDEYNREKYIIKYNKIRDNMYRFDKEMKSTCRSRETESING